jgi:putative ABC transport system substrate-binding protein
MPISPTNRRTFIAGLGGAAAWPVVTRAQQGERMRRIGIMMAYYPDGIAEFKNELQRLGWTDGKNVTFEERHPDGSDNALSLATDLNRANVDVIAVNSAGLASIARQVSSTIPIVVAVSGDLEGAGLVSSLRRPGGNVTGIQFLAPELMSKRLELLTQLVPNLARVGLIEPITPTGIITSHYYEVIEDAAHAMGIQIHRVPAHGAAEFATAFASMVQAHDQAALVIANPLSWASRNEIASAAAQNSLPLMYDLRPFVTEGGLMSYGPNLIDGYRGAAGYVDKILRGAKPGDLPIQQPTKFELIINLKAAKQINLPIPASVLARADEVIE